MVYYQHNKYLMVFTTIFWFILCSCLHIGPNQVRVIVT